ncbi:probable ATP-dependent RNA helicase DDX28 [Protopterus annectens]|uniref:probable ATP-dependent RNA helicase DDX28 n=1 Tax=Protopterus annectens TaxID=7888 RepID=UPI001CFB4BEE|nr:probable ATP-dependent RNA helicase DDX28 [Protopterus annectens]
MLHLGLVSYLCRQPSSARSRIFAATSDFVSKLSASYAILRKGGHAAESESKEENIIRIPCKMRRHIETVKQLRERGLRRVAVARPGKLLIVSKRPELNQHSSYIYGKFEQASLVTKGWKHKKSSGDYFIINNTENEPPVLLSETDSPQKNLPTFSSLGLCPELIQALDHMGITRPTTVQLQTVPKLMKGRNVVCAAETGSGKTLCYLLPLMHALKLDTSDVDHMSPRSVVLVPSRELAGQVQRVARTLGKPLNISVKVIGGGRGISNIKMALSECTCDVLIATPGALWKALSRRFVSLSNLLYLVLDEADTLFDESFEELIQNILQHTEIASGPLGGCGRKAQLVVIGATFPKGVGEILNDIADLRSISTVKSKKLHFLMPHVKQKFMKMKSADKFTELLQMLKTFVVEKTGKGMLVFCNSAATVNWLSYVLDDHEIKHLRLQGQMAADKRTGIFNSFQNGSVDILVCTDIASRGLDTQRVETVVNYDFPFTIADYIHRAGRVGRVGTNVLGTVISFVTHPWDVELVQKIENAARKKMPLPGMESSVTPPLIKTSLTEFDS